MFKIHTKKFLIAVYGIRRDWLTNTVPLKFQLDRILGQLYLASRFQFLSFFLHSHAYFVVATSFSLLFIRSPLSPRVYLIACLSINPLISHWIAERVHSFSISGTLTCSLHIFILSCHCEFFHCLLAPSFLLWHCHFIISIPIVITYQQFHA